MALSEPDWLAGDGIYKLNAPRTVITALERLRSELSSSAVSRARA